MKKFFFTFTLVTLLSLIAQSSSSNVTLSELKQFAKECRAELGIIEDKSIKAEDSDDQKVAEKVKCYHACFLKKLGMLVDGKVNFERAILHFQWIAGSAANDDTKAKLTKCLEKVNAENDECEVGGAIFVCLFENTSEHDSSPKPL